MKDSHNHNPANTHSGAILLFDKPHHKAEDNYESPSPTSLWLIMQGDVDEVIDLIGDSETTFMQHPKFVPHNNINNELQSPTNLFMNIAPEWKDLPQDIYGMKIYKMKCLPREWVQKSQDLRYFTMHS